MHPLSNGLPSMSGNASMSTSCIFSCIDSLGVLCRNGLVAVGIVDLVGRLEGCSRGCDWDGGLEEEGGCKLKWHADDRGRKSEQQQHLQ